ncbi:MAG: response regulator transcription factor [Thiothrix sp.]|nr:response regulator transcription factor [Thiothrix sp.]HPQ94397.1 response regulator transcription factor [Thiolinea sp.]
MLFLILDDHPLFADALRQVLLRYADHVIVRIAPSVVQAQALINSGLAFDLFLVDLKLPGLDGFSFIHWIKKQNIATPVIVISSSDTVEYDEGLQALGVMDFIHKSADSRSILKSIHAVLLLKTPAGANAGDSRGHRAPGQSTDPVCTTQQQGFCLTRRQMEILSLMNGGLSNREIGLQLNIAESTVKKHVSSLIRLFSAHNRTKCILEARRLGVLPDS